MAPDFLSVVGCGGFCLILPTHYYSWISTIITDQRPSQALLLGATLLLGCLLPLISGLASFGTMCLPWDQYLMEEKEKHLWELEKSIPGGGGDWGCRGGEG